MKNVIGSVTGFAIMSIVFCLCLSACDEENLGQGLEEPDVVYYSGSGQAGGLAHINYWQIDPETLSGREKQKAERIKSNQLHSRLFQPDQIVAGFEATGILDVNGRRQWVTLKLPDVWNGDLVVCGTPGLRNEYASEAIFVPWLLEQGYAVVSGDKGLPQSWISMLTGAHPSSHWGMMMHDMARWARRNVARVTMKHPRHIYAVGLSNGGYQVRRALELDVQNPRGKRLFDGGLDWSGAYYPDKRVLDANHDGIVDIPEYYQAKTLVGHMDVSTLTMGWAYEPDTLITPEQYALSPRYPSARQAMESAGFSPESDIFWGYYNINSDYYKDHGLPQWKGVGYANLISHVYRAELMGHTLEGSQVYSCFFDPEQPDAVPPLYSFLETVEYGGWTDEGVHWALMNANTGEFEAPLVTVVGQSDGLLALNAHSTAYAQAVETYGNMDLYRIYLIEHGPHVDAHADGLTDFNFDGIWGNDGAADKLTPMQAYARRAFEYLVQWVEKGDAPPASRTVETDPMNDISDPDMLSW